MCLACEYLPEKTVYALAGALAQVFGRLVKHHMTLLEEDDVVEHTFDVGDEVR